MIVLAVITGFFAEKLREHITNKKTEKEIILALQKDLKKDTATLKQLIIYVPIYDS